MMIGAPVHRDLCTGTQLRLTAQALTLVHDRVTTTKSYGASDRIIVIMR